MYTPKKMDITELSTIHRFIESYPFASLITHCNDQFNATHLPFTLKPNEGQYGCLYAHMAKANSHWENLEDSNSLIIFTGPHAYISPSWSNTKPTVPTWNYTTVHISGYAQTINKSDTKILLDDMIDFFDPNILTKDSSAMSDEHTHKLLNAIVGFKIEISSFQGKFKLSQHKPLKDQQCVSEGLSQSTSENAQQLLKFMHTWGYIPENPV